MPRVDPPYPSIASVLSAPKPRSPPSLRLPAYRASYVGRYHPYPRCGRVACRERLTEPLESRYEEEAAWGAEEPVAQTQPQARICVEAPDDDDAAAAAAALLYEDESLTGAEVEPAPQAGHVPPETTPAALKLAEVALVLLAMLRRRYRSRLGVIKGLLKFESEGGRWA
ncbi:hypothetical protein BC628DRAFT_751801 [Trametes gibbosa]|nr:hypothetical protein BC628DRAFT_751801 [Trametes gibbosa]